MHDPSPLWAYDEELEKESRRAALRDAIERKRAAHRPHEVGSIESLNAKISNLEKELKCHSVLLVVDSYSKIRGMSGMSVNDKDEREMSHFASVFSTKMAMESAKVEKPSTANKRAPDQKSSSEPVLVELAVFPGYSDEGPTPLPGVLQARKQLQLVIQAQTDLHKKPSFKAEWERLFLCEFSVSIFIDCFWWYFLQRFQPNQSVQDKLFHRTAFNYVAFLRLPIEPKFKEPFLTRYADSIAQAIYHTFCVAYPTSYKRFGEDFRNGLCSFVSLWMTGIQPVPRTWLKWNFDLLEPVNMFKLIADQEKSKETNLVKARGQDLAQFLGLKEESTVSASTSHVMDDQSQPPESTSTATKDKMDASAISVEVGTASKVQKPSAQRSRIQQKKKTKESCPAGRGPDFDRFLFNLNGHSPLVSYYGKVIRMAPDTEVVQLVQRTQITKLPPLNAPTYKDVLHESFQNVRDTKAGCQSLWKSIAQDRHKIHVRHAVESVRDRKRAAKLLAQQKEVKRLSNLLTVELLQPPSETKKPIGAAEEIARVLAKQDVD
ncbi:protein FAM227A-like [Oscarella lobularis]|uniref:protein FAM227A-like n=1 Tax=Oscarella lobularis TaxID=121494 RepID=UPI00331332FC